MSAYPTFPDRLHWDADALARAVPRRLHELFAYHAPVDARASANAATRIAPPRPLRAGYARNRAPAPFRVG